MPKRRKDDDPTIYVDRNEIMKLTKMAKAGEFTCSFCFKKFRSAQAMGGHQNAHRDERLEEKRQFVRDPIAYRKHAYLRSIKNTKTESSGQQNSCSNDENVNSVLMNFFPPKELSLAESVGVVHAADAKGKACVEIDIGYGINLGKLDLTLKL